MRKTLALLLGFNSHFSYALTANNNALGHAEFLRVVLGLCLVLVLIFVLSWILKRLNATNLTTAKGLKALAVMALGAKEKMILVQVGERYLLIGITTGNVNLLCDFGEQLPAGFEGETKTSFAALLKSVSGKA